MVDDVLVRAAGVDQGIGQDRQVGEIALRVHVLGHLMNEAVLPVEPGGVDRGCGMQWASKNAPNKVRLKPFFLAVKQRALTEKSGYSNCCIEIQRLTLG